MWLVPRVRGRICELRAGQQRRDLLRLEKAAGRARPPPRAIVFRLRVAGLRLRGTGRSGVSGFQLRNRHQDLAHLTVHVTRRARPAMTKQPRDFAHRLPGALIGNAVNDNDGDATGLAHHLLRMTGGWPLKQLWGGRSMRGAVTGERHKAPAILFGPTTPAYELGEKSRDE